MPVDPTLPRKILVVHGVQPVDNAGLTQHETLRDLVTDRLNNLPVNFETDIYRYEDVNERRSTSSRASRRACSARSRTR